MVSVPSADGHQVTSEQALRIGGGGVVVILLLLMFTGQLDPTYFLFLFGLGGMFALLSMGLNVQWGYTGLINFSVAAFFGLGAYGTALMTAGNSPIAGDVDPLIGLCVGLGLATLVAILISAPTLRLRADYLAIASLGLAEVVRMIILNESQWTSGSQGLFGIPLFYGNWPVIGTLPETLPTATVALGPGDPVTFGTPFWQELLNVLLMLSFLAGAFFVLQRAHRSPWGRVLRTIRADENLAKALGKHTYWFKMQAFVLGSIMMALAGVFFAHLQLFINPSSLDPITTFYVWVAVILGGSGSNRGALFGGFVVVTIREGSRFLDAIGSIPVDAAPLRLIAIGLLIILLMRFRPQGLLPPQRELIWPSAINDEAPESPKQAVRPARRADHGGDHDE